MTDTSMSPYITQLLFEKQALSNENAALRASLRVLASCMLDALRNAGGIDAWDVHEKMKEAGLIHCEPYDPKKHGDEIDSEIRDEIWILSDLGKELMKLERDNGEGEGDDL